MHQVATMLRIDPDIPLIKKCLDCSMTIRQGEVNDVKIPRNILGETLDLLTRLSKIVISIWLAQTISKTITPYILMSPNITPRHKARPTMFGSMMKAITICSRSPHSLVMYSWKRMVLVSSCKFKVWCKYTPQ